MNLDEIAARRGESVLLTSVERDELVRLARIGQHADTLYRARELFIEPQQRLLETIIEGVRGSATQEP